ncbi:MAG: S9 family peptidase [Thermoanaerobaculia bacterium]|nr:S9 family peptidase [Thermoanaerobaculia bacterium]
MTPRLAAPVLAALLTLPAAAQQTQPTLDAIFAEGAGGRLPSQLAWAPDGRRLSYLWSDEAGGEASLRLLELPAGDERVLLAAPADGGLDVDAHHWSPDGSQLLLESGGDLYLLPAGDGELRRLTETGADEEDPKFSPDGGRVAFVRDHDLYLLDLEDGAERRLTRDGRENEILNGITDWVYWEEIWGRDSTGFWWSPDGARIAYYRFEESAVKSYPLVDFTEVYPRVEWQRYPVAGETNPTVKVGVLDLGSGATTWLDTAAEEEVYLARVGWLPGGERVAVQRLNREQDRLELLVCDPAGGGCSTLLTETWPTWVNLHQDLTFLADGGFVWSSERSGWRRLYLYDDAGAVARELTPEGWAVTALDAVVEEAGFLIYTAHPTGELGAAGRRIFRQALAGGPPRPLSPAEGWSSAHVSTATGSWVHTWGRADEPARAVVRDAEGRRIADLPGASPGFDLAGGPRWELFTLPGSDGASLPAMVLPPARPRPGERYPVIMYHYGGPGSQVVADRWSGRERSLWHRFMAERGYGVLKVDNLASAYFGKRGEDRAHRRFGEINLAAQKTGVAWLASQEWVDPERIGLWGWSGGGTHTLYSLTNGPGTWAAGVSGAPVTDWRLYDTIWTERYLDHPDDNRDGYRASSPVTYAADLADPLLIVHGTADDNVHPSNTLQMIHALVEAGRPFETAIYPRQKHGLRGAAARHLYGKMTEFFDRHLRPAP